MVSELSAARGHHHHRHDQVRGGSGSGSGNGGGGGGRSGERAESDRPWTKQQSRSDASGHCLAAASTHPPTHPNARTTPLARMVQREVDMDDGMPWDWRSRGWEEGGQKAEQ